MDIPANLVLLEEPPDDFTPYSNDDSLDGVPTLTELLLYFANLRRGTDERLDIEAAAIGIVMGGDYDSLEDELLAFSHKVTDVMPARFVPFFVSGIAFQYVKQFGECSGNVEAWLSIIGDLYFGAVLSTENAMSNISNVDIELSQEQRLHLEYKPLFGYSLGKLYVVNSATVCDLQSVFLLASAFISKDKKKISVCKNCGDYFLPASRSDEIYCDKCRKISYDRKVKNEPAQREYRKIYKTQNARKQRGQHNISGIEERFSAWHTFAKGKLQDCQNGTISLDEMVSAISGTEWMKGG